MKSNRMWRVFVIAALTLCSTLAIADQHDNAHQVQASDNAHSRNLQFDVAEAMSKFIFDEAPILPSGMPAYGNPFITQGYIYPYGTLDGASGVLADGSPEFPERVIGEWTCRGYMIGNGAETVTGPWVITTQHYDFYAKAGYAEGKQSSRLNLVTEGYELADVGVKFERAVTGGTGKFRKARGQAVQSLLGFNDSEGVKLRFKIRVR